MKEIMYNFFFGGGTKSAADESDATGSKKSAEEKRKQEQKAKDTQKQQEGQQQQQHEEPASDFNNDGDVEKQQNQNRQQQQPKNASPLSSSSKKKKKAFKENIIGEGEEGVPQPPPPPQQKNQQQHGDAAMIAIIPLKFAQYLDPVLVREIEQLPSKSKRRLKARNIVKNNNDLLQMGQPFDNAFIEQLTHELTILIEIGGSNAAAAEENLAMEKHMRMKNIGGHQQHFENKNQTARNGGLNFDGSSGQFKPMPYSAAANLMPPPPPSLSAADNFPPPITSADWQIAIQQQQQEIIMAKNSTRQMAQLIQQQFDKTVEQLQSCNIANFQLQLGQTMPMENQFNLQAPGQQENLQMMLNTSTPIPQFGQMNFDSNELAQQPDMNMQGIAEGIEKANKKSYNAYGTRAIEFMEKFEHEQNSTARDHVQQAQLTNRHNSDNVLKQNTHMMNVKSDVMSKEIAASNEIALKNVKARVMLGNETLKLYNNKVDKNFQLHQEQLASNYKLQQDQQTNNFKLQDKLVEKTSEENMAKIKIAGQVLEKQLEISGQFLMKQQKNQHEKEMKLLETFDQKMQYEYNLKLGSSCDPHMVKLLQQGQKEYMKQKNEGKNYKEILANNLKEKQMDHEHALEMKREEHKNASAINESNQNFALKQQRLQMKQMKMQQNFAMQQQNVPHQSRPSSSASVASSFRESFCSRGTGMGIRNEQQPPQGEANQQQQLLQAKKKHSTAANMVSSSSSSEDEDDDEGLVSEPEESSSSVVGVDEGDESDK